MSCLAVARLRRKPREPGFQQHMTMACFQNSAAPGGIKRGRCPPIASPRRDLALSFRQTVSAALTQYGGGQGMRDSGYFLEIIHTGMVNAGLRSAERRVGKGGVSTVSFWGWP